MNLIVPNKRSGVSVAAPAFADDESTLLTLSSPRVAISVTAVAAAPAAPSPTSKTHVRLLEPWRWMIDCPIETSDGRFVRTTPSDGARSETDGRAVIMSPGLVGGL